MMTTTTLLQRRQRMRTNRRTLYFWAEGKCKNNNKK